MEEDTTVQGEQDTTDLTAQEVPVGAPAPGESDEASEAAETVLEADPALALTDEPLINLAIWIGAGIVVGILVRAIVRMTLGRLARRTESVVDDQMLDIVQRAVFRIAVLAGLILANHSWPGEDYPRGTVDRILQTIGLFMLTGLAGRFAHFLLEALSRAPDRFKFVEPRTRPVFEILAKVLLVGGSIYLFLGIWDINATAWLASAGIVGIAVGFAAQDT